MAQKQILPHNIRVDRNCQPTWVTQNAIPEEQELILLRGGHYDPLPDKVGLRAPDLYENNDDGWICSVVM